MVVDLSASSLYTIPHTKSARAGRAVLKANATMAAEEKVENILAALTVFSRKWK